MANAMYPNAKAAFIKGDLDWDDSTATFRAVLVTSAYTYDQTHQFLSDVPSAARIATAEVTGRSVTVSGADARALASDTAFSAVTSGYTANAVIVYHDTGVETTSELVAYVDTGTNLPMPTNGGDIAINWDDTNGVFYW